MGRADSLTSAALRTGRRWFEGQRTARIAFSMMRSFGGPPEADPPEADFVSLSFAALNMRTVPPLLPPFSIALRPAALRNASHEADRVARMRF